jgi:hypothetical protein
MRRNPHTRNATVPATPATLVLTESGPQLWFFTDFSTLLTNCCTLADLFLFLSPKVDSSIIFSFFAFTAFLLGCSLGGMAAVCLPRRQE